MFGSQMNVFRTGGQAGQALVELTLIFPMLIMLSLGAVEISNLIYTYQVIHHLTAQGANIAARRDTGDDPIEEVISDLIDAACPVISQGTGGGNCTVSNSSRWRVIYTEIGPDLSVPTNPPYVVKEQRTAGSGPVQATKRICDSCGLATYSCDPKVASCPIPNIRNVDTISPNQSLYAFEVFYDYTPITVLGNFVGGSFAGTLYERSIF